MAKSGIKNLKAFQNKLKKRLVTNPENHLEVLVQRSASLVEGTAKESIVSGSPSGRTYEKYNPRRTHTASAAGQPPAQDQNELAQNITSKVTTKGTQVIGQIISSASYSKSLEFGTSQMSPRPFMQPALNKNRAKINRIFKAGGYIK